MNRYLLLIQDSTKKEKEVSIDAVSPSEALDTATRHGWMVISRPKRVEEASDNTKTLVTLLSALQRLLEGGLTVQEGLQYLLKHPKNKEQKILSEHLLGDIKSGVPLSQAVHKANTKTPEFFLNLLQLGEQSGRMNEALSNLLQYVEEEKKINEGIAQALVYPLLTLVMLLGLSMAMGIFLLPRMQTILGGIQSAATVSELGASWLFPVVLVFIWSIPIVLLLLFPHRNLMMDSFWERFPILGNWWLVKDYFVFTFSVELLAERGFPLEQAIDSASRNVFLTTTKQRCRLALEKLKQGKPLSELFQSSGFPDEFQHWTSLGEATGNVSGVFHQLKTYYKNNVEKISEQLKKWIEPMMTVVVGLFLFIFIGIYVVPMFQALETAL